MSPVWEQSGTKFVSSAQCFKCFQVAQGWPEKTLEQLVALLKSDPMTRDAWERAGKILDGVEQRNWRNSSGVHSRRTTGLRMESLLWFITEGEFLSEFLISPTDVCLTLLELQNETNTGLVKGVLVRISEDDSPDRYRRVTLFSETVVDVDELVLDPTMQLRKEHAEELFKKLAVDRVAGRSQACGFSSRPLTFQAGRSRSPCTNIVISL